MRGWRRQHRAKADLLWGAVFGIALQLGLFVALHNWLAILRDPNYVSRAERFRHRLRHAGSRPLTVVSLGSSRVMNGLSGLDVEEELSRSIDRSILVCNLGMPGGGAVRERLVLGRFLACGERPDLVLIEVVPWLLDQSYGEHRTIPVSSLWHDEIDLLARYGSDSASLRRQWWSAELLPWHGHRFEIVSVANRQLLPLYLERFWCRGADASGWLPARTANAEQRRYTLQKTHADFAPKVRDLHLSGDGPQALRDTIDLVRRHRLRPVLLQMPESPAFRSFYSALALRQVEAFINDLRNEFDIAVIDARDWIDEEGFNDGQHLQPSGAVAFSKRLGRDVLPRLLSEESTSVRLAAK